MIIYIIITLLAVIACISIKCRTDHMIMQGWIDTMHKLNRPVRRTDILGVERSIS